MLLAVDLEVQLSGAFLGNVGNISLASELATGATFIRLSIMFTDQVEDTGGGGLVLCALGEEQKTLAGLAGPGGDGVGDGGLLVLVEGRQLLRLNSVVAEVEETLGETEAPVLCHTPLVTAYRKPVATSGALLDETGGLVTQDTLRSGGHLLLLGLLLGLFGGSLLGLGLLRGGGGSSLSGLSGSLLGLLSGGGLGGRGFGGSRRFSSRSNGGGSRRSLLDRLLNVGHGVGW